MTEQEFLASNRAKRQYRINDQKRVERLEACLMIGWFGVVIGLLLLATLGAL